MSDAGQMQGYGLWSLGAYARVRHPQYVAFVLILFGFLLQWPTLVTLVMFPILVLVYARLAAREEADMAARFGAEWHVYAARTPRFIPVFKGGAHDVGRI